MILISVVGVIVIGTLGYIAWKTSQGQPVPGQGPTEEEKANLAQYEEKCPLETLLFEDDSDVFELISVDCSYNALSDLSEEGEVAIVEVYSQDFEMGKQEFYNWLSSHGLEEGDSLRVTFEHKPR